MIDVMTIRSRLRALWALLWLDYSKVDQDLRDEIEERSLLGLRIVSAFAIVGPMLHVLALGLWRRESIAEESFVAMIGLAGLLISRTPWAARHARGLAVLVGYLMALFAIRDMSAAGGHASPEYATLLIINLLVVITVPLRPLAAIGFGLGLSLMFAVSALIDPGIVSWPPPAWFERLVLLVVFAFLSGGLLAHITRLHLQEHESRGALTSSLEELRRMQANLIESKRAASQGRLAAALGHEMNNPLSVVVTNQELIGRHLAELCGKLGDDEAAARLVSGAEKAAVSSQAALERISDVVERFQRFSNLDTAERRRVDVNELLDDAIGVLSPGWDSRVRVIKDYGELPQHVASPSRLIEVFRNLLSNAASALDGEGEIRVSTRYARGYVWVQIADDGRGIATDQLGSIFEPGFRVSGGRVSTGWGLFISRQIVHDHNGEFHISSEPGEGTRVEVCLPVGVEENG